MRRLARTETVPAVLVMLALVAGALESRYFLDPYYLLDSFTLYAERGLLVLGMTFVIVSGHIDLSVASNLGLCACALGKMTAAGVPAPLAVVVTIGLGGGLGAINGGLIAYAKRPAFLVTLATLALYRGIAQAWMGAESVPIPKRMSGIDHLDLPLTPVPVPLAIFLLLAVLLGLSLHRTVFGRQVFALGSNAEATRHSGVPTSAVTLRVFILMGILCGLAAAIFDSRLGVARFDHAQGMELDVITATVLGGASIYGGRGTIAGSVLALLFVALVGTGMGLANVSAELQLAVVGALLILCVAANAVAARLGERHARVADV